MPEHPFLTTTASLAGLLQRLALDLAAAQQALDREAERQADEAAERGSAIPTLAFHFSELEVDLRLGLSYGRYQGPPALVAAPAHPAAAGFFGAVAFSSRLRARIATRPRDLATQTPEEGPDD
jgi:hypothetical protein